MNVRQCLHLLIVSYIDDGCVHWLQVGVVGSGQGMTDYKNVARHDFNPDAE